MKETVCMDAVDAIYAAFGKAKPAQRISDAIYRKVRNLPDVFMPYARERLEELESLPANLGLYLLRSLWPDFLDKNPQLRARETKGCPECDGKTPGWFYAWKDGYRYLMRCACNPEDGKGPDVCWNRRRAREAGYSLEDQLTAGEGMYPGAEQRQELIRAIGTNEPPRPRHLEELERQEFEF